MDANSEGDGNANESRMCLSRHLAACGVASRRTSAEWILAGRVTVNRRIERNPGVRVAPDDCVLLDGKEILPEKKITVMLNKPQGYVCTARDSHAEKTVFDLVSIPGARLFHVGRLDRDSEGLLLLTNDGDFAARITHPRYRVEKRYHVELSGPLSVADVRAARSGIVDEGETLRAEAIRHLGNNVYEFVLREGKKREIRRMVRSLGKKTIRLTRTAIGGLLLGDLESSRWRKLNDREIESCFEPLSPSGQNTVLSSLREGGRSGRHHRSRSPFP